MPREALGPWPSPTHGPGPAPPGSLPEGETEAMSNAQRSTLKWEKEETLGELATVAPVLYTNINFPNLKEEYPGLCMALKHTFSFCFYMCFCVFQLNLLLSSHFFLLHCFVATKMSSLFLFSPYRLVHKIKTNC